MVSNQALPATLRPEWQLSGRFQADSMPHSYNCGLPPGTTNISGLVFEYSPPPSSTRLGSSVQNWTMKNWQTSPLICLINAWLIFRDTTFSDVWLVWCWMRNGRTHCYREKTEATVSAAWVATHR